MAGSLWLPQVKDAGHARSGLMSIAWLATKAQDSFQIHDSSTLLFSFKDVSSIEFLYLLSSGHLFLGGFILILSDTQVPYILILRIIHLQRRLKKKMISALSISYHFETLKKKLSRIRSDGLV